jgi:hypothetical protein
MTGMSLEVIVRRADTTANTAKFSAKQRCQWRHVADPN